MNELKQIGISMLTAIIMVLVVFYFLPVWNVGNIVDENLGASVTTISGSDKMSEFPTTYNANLNALNNGKLERSDWFATTSAPQLTTLENLATVGTITTGTWNASTLTVAKGGTGSTTLTENAVLLGNGTGAINHVAGLGTSGQVLKSQGAGNPPIWDSSSLDESQAYDWTGAHSWTTGTTTFNSAATFTATATFNNYVSLEDDPVEDTHAIKKSYFEGKSAVPGIYSSFSNNGAGTSTESIATDGRAGLMHFTVNIQEDEQTGSSITKVRVYDVWFDLIDQTYSSITLYTTDTGDDETCGMTGAGADDNYVYTNNAAYTSMSSLRVNELDSGDSYFADISSDSDSIDITTYSSADGCIYVGSVFYW